MKSLVRRIVIGALQGVALPVFAAALVVMWVPVRMDSALRRWRGTLPRIVWGPTGLINSVYYARAVERHGFRARAVAYDLDGVFDRRNWDLVFGDAPWVKPLRPILPFVLFLYLLPRFDIFYFYFNVEGYLMRTPLRYIEYPLLKFFGKKIVCQAYGADVQRVHLLPDCLRPHYVIDAAQDRRIARNVAHSARWADFKVSGGDLFRYMPYDICTLFIALDLDLYRPVYPTSDGNRTVQVVHATGHPQLKGTEAIARACRELRLEGHDVEYVFVTGIDNDHARAIYETADVIVDQLLLGSCGVFGVEGMALGKPVISHLSEDVLVANPTLAACPIVRADTATLKERLRELVVDPALRHRLGRESRRYVETYHSFDYIGRLLEAIFRHVWLGAPAPAGPRALPMGETA